MALSNTAVPKYYGEFRDAVIRGEIPVCREIEMEMNRIDDLIADPDIYYDDQAVEGFIKYCENELTLTDGSDLKLLDSFKVWAEQIFGWYEFEEERVYVPYEDGYGGRYVTKVKKKRLINKQYLIVARGAAKSMYGSCLQNFFLNVDVTTTHQITTAPTMKQAEEVLSPIRTAITRSRGPFYKFLTDGSLQNTTGSKANRMKLASTKKGIENFLTGSLLEVRPMRIDKLQGLQLKMATVDEWLSGDIREDVIGAIEQGASKVEDIRCMTITQNVKPEVYNRLENEHIDQVNAYIEDPMTATWFREEKNKTRNNEIITSERIYYWMIALQIPVNFEKWHLNRLLTLIRVCNEENKPKKKMSRRELINQRRAENEARKKKWHTKG